MNPARPSPLDSRSRGNDGAVAYERNSPRGSTQIKGDRDDRGCTATSTTQQDAVPHPRIFFIASPIYAGDSTTVAPAASKALFFSDASPALPVMMAPACPIRLPAGAVCPAIEATTGLVTFFLDELSRRLFTRPADLADHYDGFGFVVVLEFGQDIDEVGSGYWVTADADAG